MSTAFTKEINVGSPHDINPEALVQQAQSCIEAEPDKAVNFLRKAIDMGCTSAMTYLAHLYIMGKGVKKNYSEAFKLNEQASKKGDLEGIYNLGKMYGLGFGVTKNHKKAFEYYEEAAEKGLDVAMLKLGALYSVGKGVEQDYKKMLFWKEKLALKLGSDDMLTDLGFACFRGLDSFSYSGKEIKGMERDVKKAIYYWNKQKIKQCGIILKAIGWYSDGLSENDETAIVEYLAQDFFEIGNTYENSKYPIIKEHYHKILLCSVKLLVKFIITPVLSSSDKGKRPVNYIY